MPRNRKPPLAASDVSYRVFPNSRLMRLAPSQWEAFATAEGVHLRGNSITPALLAHEGTHVVQLRQAGGTIRGWLRWILLLLRTSYDTHPWELQARAVEQLVAGAGNRANVFAGRPR